MYNLPSFMLNKHGKVSVLQAILDDVPQLITAPGKVEGWGRAFTSPSTSYRGCHVVLYTASWLIINL